LGEVTHRFNHRHLADSALFKKTAARVAGRRITYKELTTIGAPA